MIEENSKDLMENGIEEILRWTSPVHFNRRTACADMLFKGQQIKRGDKVTVWYPSANRDEEIFDEPFKFNIYRKNASKQISFGHGMHHCIGAALARMEIRIFFEEFLKRYGHRTIETVGSLKYLRSNRHQGLAQCNIKRN